MPIGDERATEEEETMKKVERSGTVWKYHQGA